MRLLYLTIDGLPTFRPDISVLFGKCLPAEGIWSDMVTVRQPEPPGEGPLWPAGEAFTTPRRGNALRNGLADFWHDCCRLWNFKKGDYQAVQLRDKTFIGLVALAVARWQGVPFFYWMSFPYGASLLQLSRSDAVRHNWPRRFYLWWRGAVGNWLLHAFVLKCADHVFVQSDRMCEDLVARGIDRERMTPVPMGIDPERFPAILPSASLPGIPADARVLGYLGEASRRRRPDFLIEAVATLRMRWPNVFLLIVGDAVLAEEQAWLRDYVSKVGLADRCMITGWVSPTEATKALAAAEICLALMAPDPVLDSTSPTKLVEYMAMGRPVVANNHPDQTLVIESAGAGLVTPFESDAYAEAIGRLLDMSDQHTQMAERGRAWVLAERGYPTLAAKLAAKYRALLKPESISV